MAGAPLQLLAEAQEDGQGWTLRAPGVGLVRDLPVVGACLEEGMACGELDILGVRHALRLPPSLAGQVGKVLAKRERLQPVAHGDALFTLQLQLEAQEGAAATTTATGAAQGLVLRAPQAGRFYTAPEPDAPPFVQVGDVLEMGRTVGLLEVMKTFSPVKVTAAHGFPGQAKVKAILVQDRTDVEEGTPLLEVES